MSRYKIIRLDGQENKTGDYNGIKYDHLEEIEELLEKAGYKSEGNRRYKYRKGNELVVVDIL